MPSPLLRSLAALLAGVAFVAAAAAAEVEAPQKVASIEGVTEYRLGNGLRILTVPDPSASTVTVHVTYFVGSRNEGYGERGMAHLLEHMLFRGSTHHPDPKAELAKRGARFNGTTGEDRTTYYETLAAEGDNLDWALSLEADRMTGSFVRKSDLDSEMTVVRNEFEMGENNPGRVLAARMMRLAFSAHNYGNPVIGFRSDIESVPIERLQAFYRTWYQPDNALLIIGGRFDEARALELAAQDFGALPRPARALPIPYTVEPPQDGERRVTLRRVGDTQLVEALYHIPAASHPDMPAIDVLTSIFGAAPTGRLHRALVQTGLASSAWSYQQLLHDPGYALFGAAVPKDAPLAPVRDALLQAVEAAARTPFTEEEVARARTSLLNDMERAPLDSPGFVRWLSEFAAVGDWRLFFLYRDGLRKVTPADVQRVAAAYLKRSNRVLGQFVPTDHPDRATIPPAPDLQAELAGYHGSEHVAAGERFDPTPANIEARVVRRTLENGIRVALLPKKTRGGRVHAQLSLYWGDAQSKMNRSTACSLAGGMLMRGTREHTRAQLRDALDQLNANVAVGLEGAAIDVRGDRLADTLRLVAEMLRQPAFPAQEFAELKRAMLAGAESRRSDPSAIAAERLMRHISPYPRGHWLYTPAVDEAIGDIKDATLAQARSCYADLVGATGALFTAVGDFDPAAVSRQIDALFGGWKSPAPYARIPSRYFEIAPVEETVRTPDKANAVLRAAANIALRDDDPDYPALVLGNYLLGGNFHSRLVRRVREKEGLSYSTYSYFSASPLDRSAIFGVAAIYAPQNRDRIEHAIREEIARALKDGFTDAELAAGKQGLLEARRLARTDDGTLAGRLASYLYLGRSFAWDAEFEQRIAALTAAQVRDATRRHIDPARLTVLKAGDFR